MKKNVAHNLNLKHIRKIQEQRITLGEKKHHDYSAIVDAIPICGIEGLALELFKKACRLLTLSRQKGLVKTESIRDTLLDMGNYSDYAVTLLDEKW